MWLKLVFTMINHYKPPKKTSHFPAIWQILGWRSEASTWHLQKSYALAGPELPPGSKIFEQKAGGWIHPKSLGEVNHYFYGGLMVNNGE